MKRIWGVLLSAMLMLMSAACAKPADAPTEIPADFAFSLTWGVYGVSFYDSESGELIKSNAEPEKEKYTATLILTDDQLRQAWEAVASLDWDAYVTEDGTYDPNPGLRSDPSLKLELIVTENGQLHRILCSDVAMTGDSPDAQGQALLTACQTLQDLLTSTPEWQAMPDYTVLFY